MPDSALASAGRLEEYRVDIDLLLRTHVRDLVRSGYVSRPWEVAMQFNLLAAGAEALIDPDTDGG